MTDASASARRRLETKDSWCVGRALGFRLVNGEDGIQQFPRRHHRPCVDGKAQQQSVKPGARDRRVLKTYPHRQWADHSHLDPACCVHVLIVRPGRGLG